MIRRSQMKKLKEYMEHLELMGEKVEQISPSI